MSGMDLKHGIKPAESNKEAFFSGFLTRSEFSPFPSSLAARRAMSTKPRWTTEAPSSIRRVLNMEDPIDNQMDLRPIGNELLT